MTSYLIPFLTQNDSVQTSSLKSIDDIRAEVSSLVERTTPGKSVDALMNEYKGREEELISHLRRLLNQGLSLRSEAKGGVIT